MRGMRAAAAATAGLILALGCGEGDGTPSPATPDRPTAPAAPPSPPPAAAKPRTPEPAVDVTLAGDASRGAGPYATFCASCHGPRGCGEGPLAASLDPTPAKHCDGSYMNALSDAHLFKVIKEGGPAVGKSPLMAAWGGSLNDADIRDVIAFMRTLADPPYQGGS